ncbi:MAG TPA: class I tRNA ligase family protein, partial [Thermoleophilia bacterium]|nr:class I tRNA ligase family protein [Thermoleophilia bacterium]
TDFDIGRDHRLPTVQAIGPDGHITDEGGPYAGLSIADARERVIGDLRGARVLERVEDYSHSVATCHRCGTHIEPLISLQWFMRMDELKRPATEVVRDGRVRFTPERWGRVYIDWMENLRPWCISRQLWWGHQLPVWYCEREGCDETIVAETEPTACPACGGTALRRETDVLDTWFSSALWPFATWGWPDQTPDLEYFYPTNLLSTAREIIFLWVARMVMMGLEFVGDIPFHEVYIHSVIQAADGRRMSKSLGTGIDPLEMIAKYGADASRFALLLMSSSQDVRFSEEKIAMGRNFANKLWNAGRLVLLAADGAAPAKSDADQVDRWITSRLAHATTAVGEALDVFAFSVAVDELYHFVWDEVCDWYLELVKPRLYSDDPETRSVAAGHAMYVLDGVVRLLHPFMPFVTEEIASHYGAAPLLDARYAVAGEDDRSPSDEEDLGQVQAAIQALRTYRADHRIAPADVLTTTFVADDGSRTAELYAAFAPAFRSLARVTLAGAAAGGDETMVLVPGGRFEVAAPQVDRSEELARLRAQLEKLEGEVRRSEAKLGNTGFVSRAPEAVVEKERAKLAGYLADRDELAARLESLS